MRSNQGVAATLASGFHTPLANTTDAIASVYAELATRLGYFEPLRLLSEAEWSNLLGIDWANIELPTIQNVIERVGPPSYSCSKSQRWTRVLSYVGPAKQWLHFDFEPAKETARLRFIRRHQCGATNQRIIDLLAGSRHDTAEGAYRRFFLATLTGDRAQIEPLLASRHEVSLLWSGAYPPDVAANLAAVWAKQPVFEAPPEDEVRWLQSTDGVALRVVRERDGWKVDPEPLLKLRAESEQMH